MPDHSKWATKQVNVLVGIGVNILDAQRAVSEFLALLPPGADPDTYIVPARDMEQDISDPKYVDDAAAAWVANDDIDSRFKLIILAGDESIG